MDPLRILILEPDNYSSQAMEMYHSLGQVDRGPLSRDELLRNIQRYDVLVVRLAHKIDKDLLSKATRLKVIASPTTGTDHIDEVSARKAGIELIFLKGEKEFLRSIPATAELTWGLLLALTRNIPAAYSSVLSGHWDRDTFRGHDLAGKTLGILGLGRIGEKIAEFGITFRMKVIAFDPYRDDWPPKVEKVSSIRDLFSKSQVLSIHVPLNDSTKELVDRNLIQLLPKDAKVINTSRGRVICEKDLLSALKSGKISGAALDVIASENTENPADSLLIDFARNHSNLIITPHLGGATIESMRMTEDFIAAKTINFIQNRMQHDLP